MRVTSQGTTMPVRTRLLTVAVLGLLAAALAPAPGAAAAPEAAALSEEALLRQAEKAGGTRVNDRVVFPGGGIVVTHGQGGADCPEGWLCLFEHANHNRDRSGSLWKFRAVTSSWQALGPFGAADRVSSYRNRSPQRVQLRDDGRGVTSCISPSASAGSFARSVNDTWDRVWVQSSRARC